MMKRIHFLLLLLLFGCDKPHHAEMPTAAPQRIISLAPDITEIVYQLGLGDKLVGASTYCTYPEAAATLPRVGGFGQFNFEAIVSLNPDLVLLHWQSDAEKARLDGLGIPYLETRTEYIENILESIRAIGKTCGAVAEAETYIANVHKHISTLRKFKNPPRILVTFSGDATQVDQIYAFGSACLHNELLELAGGTNVVENDLAFSVLSKEAVIRLNPDIIIQLAPGTPEPENPSNAWESLSGVNAVKNKRVYVLTGDYTCIPGPRFIQILNDFAGIIRQND